MKGQDPHPEFWKALQEALRAMRKEKDRYPRVAYHELPEGLHDGFIKATEHLVEEGEDDDA